MKAHLMAFLLAPIFTPISAAAVSPAGQPTIDNERIAVSDGRGVQPPAQQDFVSVSLSRTGTASFGHRGAAAGVAGARTVIIELKVKPIGPLANSTSYPLAYPRRHAKKLLENDRVVVWQYTWHAGEPTPMHFHDKDALVVFEGDGAVKSRRPKALGRLPLLNSATFGLIPAGEFIQTFSIPAVSGP